MPPTTSNLTETLANLNIFWILGIVAALSLVRFALLSSKSPAACSWSEMLESGMIAVALIFLIIRPFVLQAFFIPSASMEPTLLGNNGSGDRILVNKFDYRLHQPRRDDVVVFLAPPEATVPDGLPPDSDFIKRLIGMPGDHLEVVGGVVYVNGQPHNHADIRQALARAGEFGSDAQTAGSVSQADHHVKFVADGVLADTHLVSKSRLADILTGMPHSNIVIKPGYVIRDGQKLDEPFIGEDPDYDMKLYGGQPLKRTHGVLDDTVYQYMDLLQDQPISPAEFQKEWSLPTGAVPAGRYLMMGDNRNDSSDGTYWGTLAAHRVVGRAQFIFWPPSRMGVIH
jgi:signal peptidase I